jgi:hypothetical protein
MAKTEERKKKRKREKKTKQNKKKQTNKTKQKNKTKHTVALASRTDMSLSPVVPEYPNVPPRIFHL